MAPGWKFISALGAIAVIASVIVFVWIDRRATLDNAKVAASSNARILAAHAEASLGEASQIVAAILPDVDAWDLDSDGRGRDIHDELQRLVRTSPRVTSAWVLNAEGATIAESWNYPPADLNSSGRSYFKRHLAGQADPVISGRETGGVTGRTRFTYSHALRGTDGGLRAVVAVGLLTQSFDALYAAAAVSPGALAGLYSTRGEILAESENGPNALGSELGALSALAAEAESGVVEIDILGDRRLVAWQAIPALPRIFAASSQPVAEALMRWQFRTQLLVAMAALMILLLTLLIRSLSLAKDAQASADLAEITSREVHHRMKNSLQMISSVVRLRARASGQPEVQTELDHVAAQLRALAEVQNLLLVGEDAGRVSLGDVLARLCDRVGASHAHQIAFASDPGVEIDAGDAGRIAIIANELITNAMKHGDGRVDVRLSSDGRHADLLIANGGNALPESFDISRSSGFGLRTVHAVAESMGAEIAAGIGGALGGSEFRMRIPLHRNAGEPAPA